MPTLIYDIMRVMFALTGPAAFICLVNAGIALRKEGGTVFWVGGGFSRWMLWTVIFLALEPTLVWFQFLGFPVFFPAGSGDRQQLALRNHDGPHDVRERFRGRAPRTGPSGFLRHASSSRYRERHRTVAVDVERDVSVGNLIDPRIDRRLDTGGQPLLDRARAGIDVELPGEPDLSARGGIGDLRGDHSVRFQPPRISAVGRLRWRLSDGQRAVASDQSNDVTGEEQWTS